MLKKSDDSKVTIASRNFRRCLCVGCSASLREEDFGEPVLIRAARLFIMASSFEKAVRDRRGQFHGHNSVKRAGFVLPDVSVYERIGWNVAPQLMPVRRLFAGLQALTCTEAFTGVHYCARANGLSSA